MTGAGPYDPLPTHVEVMADYGADPLWDESPGGGGMLELARMPLSPELRARLRAWADDHDRLLGARFEWPSAEVGRAWVARGAALAEEVQAELGPDVVVRYPDVVVDEP